VVVAGTSRIPPLGRRGPAPTDRGIGPTPISEHRKECGQEGEARPALNSQPDQSSHGTKLRLVGDHQQKPGRGLKAAKTVAAPPWRTDQSSRRWVFIEQQNRLDRAPVAPPSARAAVWAGRPLSRSGAVAAIEEAQTQPGEGARGLRASRPARRDADPVQIPFGAHASTRKWDAQENWEKPRGTAEKASGRLGGRSKGRLTLPAESCRPRAWPGRQDSAPSKGVVL